MFTEEKVKTPKSDGYYMPAEWHKHEACWMAWPYDKIAWRGHHREGKHSIATLANSVSEFEPVKMLVPPQAREEAERFLGKGVEIVECEIDDAWTRDTCPSFVLHKDGGLAGVNWNFNGWGDLDVANWESDKKLARRVCRQLDVPCYDAPIFNEGGAIHVDGEGTVLCTRSTILNDNRNPEHTEEEVEQILCDYLGVEKVIWLDEGYEQDETDGHIDVIACFVAPGKVMHLSTENKNDPNYSRFEQNMAYLESQTDAKDRKIEVIRMPQPSLWIEGDRRISCSYVNYYIANGAVFVPVFNDPVDELAVEIFKALYPDRKIIDMPENAANFYGGGGIHCCTQQQPAI
ncbi:agmatine deiminase family protein [Pontiella agarivorans]|uniref:Agmatine deiminase family protein n=1 Tax=Pontiella agarivorans TaxID=3038953 RepID=A0ABU5MXP1_9BACT|nr:agmatine deiminase family protein [Pontiella agarivorans]MDZ8118969.1 agmatine deiminase family protein [Pontiella agarivorans]